VGGSRGSLRLAQSKSDTGLSPAERKAAEVELRAAQLFARLAGEERALPSTLFARACPVLIDSLHPLGPEPRATALAPSVQARQAWVAKQQHAPSGEIDLTGSVSMPPPPGLPAWAPEPSCYAFTTTQARISASLRAYDGSDSEHFAQAAPHTHVDDAAHAVGEAHGEEVSRDLQGSVNEAGSGAGTARERTNARVHEDHKEKPAHEDDSDEEGGEGDQRESEEAVLPSLDTRECFWSPHCVPVRSAWLQLLQVLALPKPTILILTSLIPPS
jgi:hypothetical protein